jgi:hypothetical protein
MDNKRPRTPAEVYVVDTGTVFFIAFMIAICAFVIW